MRCRYIKNVRPSAEYTLDAEMSEPLVGGRGSGLGMNIDLDYTASSGHNGSFKKGAHAHTMTDDGGDDEDVEIYFDGARSDSSGDL